MQYARHSTDDTVRRKKYGLNGLDRVVSVGGVQTEFKFLEHSAQAFDV